VDAVNRTIDFVSPGRQKLSFRDHTADLIVRPRGWHLVEKHVLVDGRPISGSLFRFRSVLLSQRQT
jgi:malate synthase